VRFDFKEILYFSNFRRKESFFFLEIHNQKVINCIAKRLKEIRRFWVIMLYIPFYLSFVAFFGQLSFVVVANFQALKRSEIHVTALKSHPWCCATRIA